MKLRGFLLTLAGVVPLTFLAQADGGHPKSSGPMPPDPLFTNRVPSPHTAASLALRQMVDPTGLFMWELMKETEALNAAQLRTLTHELLRPRRYYRDVSPADVIVMEAWADRDLAAATADVLNIPDWEDRDDNIGDYDSDVEFFGGQLWSQLAERDFPKAVKVADRLEGYETRGQFFSMVDKTLLKPSQVAAFVRLGTRHTPWASPEDLAEGAVECIAIQRGLKEARLALKNLPEGKVRDAAQRTLGKISESGKAGSGIPARFESGNRELQRLAALDRLSPAGMRIPYPLLRAVLKLTPADALAAAGNLTEANRNASGWLPWILFMRAAEGDTAAAMAIAPDKSPSSNWGHSGPAKAIIAALTAGGANAESSLRAQAPGDERSVALAGFLSRAPLENLERWQKLARELRAPADAWQPLLVRMVMAGKAKEALAIAVAIPNPPLPNGGNRFPLSSEIMKAWALHDFAAARDYVSRLADSNVRHQYYGTLAEAAAVLPPAVALDSGHPIPDALREQLGEPYWLYLAYEAPEACLRFFEEGKVEERSAFEVGVFTRAAARYSPERALALVRRYGLTEEHFFDTLARHWPDRVVAMAKDVTSEEVWKSIGSTLGQFYPRGTATLLKGVTNTVAWEAAGGAMAQKHPSLLPRLFPHMTKEVAERLRIENAIE
jgi:hypothetical protein